MNYLIVDSTHAFNDIARPVLIHIGTCIANGSEEEIFSWVILIEQAMLRSYLKKVLA